MKRVLLVAHRTPSTRAGCARLATAGARIFEADVQLDGDDQVVVSHYLPVGRAGLLQRDNWRVRWSRAALRDPHLADVAHVVPDDCRVLLDLKGRFPSRARLCAAVISGLPERDRFLVCSSQPGELAQLRAAGFRTWRTVGSGPELRALVAGAQLPDDAVTVRHTLLTAEAVAQLHAIVTTVIAWTVNDRRRAARLRAIGVDGITTDSEIVLRSMSAVLH